MVREQVHTRERVIPVPRGGVALPLALRFGVSCMTPLALRCVRVSLFQLYNTHRGPSVTR